MHERSEIIDFADFRLVPSRRELTRNGAPVHVGDRALDILTALIRRRGEVVSKKELFESVWPKSFVEDSNLRVNVASLRKALGDGVNGTRLIASVPGRGYMFVGDAARSDLAEPQPADHGGSALTTDSGPPVLLTRIIGREEIVAHISSELASRRFVTLTGSGGIGKTAVALAVAQGVEGGYRDGVRCLDLAPLSNAALVVGYLASSLRLPSTETQPLQGVITHVKNRRLLLVLDNCEHVADAVSKIAEDILRSAPEVHILATSREPLRAAGEWVRRLAPLESPSPSPSLTAAQALEFSAVQLFVERATACDAAFELTDADAPLVADICAKLDGLPLAIELAATRAAAYGIRGLAARLDDRFKILVRGRRTADARHQTLSATIDWSYETLPEEEKTVWRRFSVFSGPFMLDAAEVIGREGADESLDPIDILGSLVDRSLVAFEVGSEPARYRLLESLRLYAFDKLTRNAEVECVRRRHADYFSRCSFGSGDSWLETPTAEWLRSHGSDIADIRAAIEWAFSAGETALAVKIIAASAPFFFKLLLVAELRGHLDRALRAVPNVAQLDDELLMRLNVALAHSIFHMLGPIKETRTALDRALAIAERLADINAQLQILWARWGIFATGGYYAKMMPSLERVRQIMLEHPQAPVRPVYDRMGALTYHLLGEQPRALRHAQAALNQAALQERARRDGVFVYDHKAATRSHLARILWLSGRPDGAVALIENALSDALKINQPFTCGFLLVFGAIPVSLWAGDIAGSSRYVDRLLDVATGITFSVWREAGRIYREAIRLINSPGTGKVETRELLSDPALTPFLEETLATFDPQLLSASAFARAEEGDALWGTAEILRAKGERLLVQGKSETARAESLFRRSLEIGRRQGALAWELRAAISLGRLWRDAHRISEAKELLGGVYERFEEGFGTRDLIDARTLLESL